MSDPTNYISGGIPPPQPSQIPPPLPTEAPIGGTPISQPPHITTVELLHTKDYTNVAKIVKDHHLTDENWHRWKERMRRVFYNCGYIQGTIVRPPPHVDPQGAANWDKNAHWAQQVIIQNVTESQMNHVGTKHTAYEMYAALSDTHENTAHQTVNYIQTLLYKTRANEGDDILQHLDTLKSYRDRMNKFPNDEFHIYDTRFKYYLRVATSKLDHLR